ncbi:hypothetical protein ECMP0209401_5078 [Escherichia coli MP020940.1]|uniref:Uncharacterized protein n=1 Tax=Escherichia coli (strain 55989 / EAEC) TaxID=585055 RepID=B7LCZ4_ECO55|nr:hypothetical protein PCN061_4434 [Escherichia coli PCN061]AVN08624.1 hypothetical protein CSC11_2362 [Escherichia coli]EFJ94193.1 hypothetical protein HMPREF9531_00697 [Escherichia coli MS 45-1]EGB88477.1 hypothetical protein HMPREF9542_02075 [Escherichia coli MS 117-3]EHW28586.1 hypothetical protein ECDEC9A_5550 [Escherichia coli DEC9A]EKH25625.1 hypothetical protein ECFDA506_0295 [Escherichia coli FDA506]EKK80562.1 hypothetical protein EC100821_5049 [Escherichia coli 10.0821]EKW21224.1 
MLLPVLFSAVRSERIRYQTVLVVNDMTMVTATVGPAVPIHTAMCPLMLKA